jgi:hypothetical protein
MIGRSGVQLWTERVKRAIYLCRAGVVTLRIGALDIRCDLSTDRLRADAARRILRRLKRWPIPDRDAAIESIEATCGRVVPGDGESERYRFLTWTEIREMAAAGVEFGSHTVTHPILSVLDDTLLDHEIRESKATIERELGRECRLFAYPNGASADFGEREKMALRASGYEAACSLRQGLNGRVPDLYDLNRVNIGRHLDDAGFEFAAAGLIGFGRRLREAIFAEPSEDGAAEPART